MDLVKIFELIRDRIEGFEGDSDQIVRYIEDMLLVESTQRIKGEEVKVPSLIKQLREAELQLKMQLRAAEVTYCLMAQNNASVPEVEKKKVAERFQKISNTPLPTPTPFEVPYDWDFSTYKTDRRKMSCFALNVRTMDQRLLEDNLDAVDARIIGLKDNTFTIGTKIKSALGYIQEQLMLQERMRRKISDVMNKTFNLQVAVSPVVTDEIVKQAAYSRYLELIGAKDEKQATETPTQTVLPQSDTHAEMASEGFDSSKPLILREPNIQSEKTNWAPERPEGTVKLHVKDMEVEDPKHPLYDLNVQLTEQSVAPKEDDGKAKLDLFTPVVPYAVTFEDQNAVDQLNRAALEGATTTVEGQGDYESGEHHHTM